MKRRFLTVLLILSFILGLFPVLPAEAGGKPESDTEAELKHNEKTGEDYLRFTLITLYKVKQQFIYHIE